jgi:predicted lipoprotein with Yx(FWY)xxD motif
VAAPALAATHHKGIKIATRHTKLGRVLTNSKGRVMYLFLKDGRKVSHCKRACAAAWPKVTSPARPRAGAGISAKHLSRTSKHQVTYYGHPLYYFASSTKPGNTSGEGLNHFFVVSVHGKPIKPKQPGKPTGPTGPAEVTTGPAGASSTEVLTGSDAHTLYALTAPDEMTYFYCDGSCLSVWQPLLTKGKPTAAGDADAGLLGTLSRPGIGTQVTYGGYPVYDYTGDTAAGQDNGEGLTGPYSPPAPAQTWDDLTPAGAINPTS